MKNFLLAALMATTVNAIAGDKGNGGDVRLIGGKYYSLDLVELGVHKNPFIDEYATYSPQIDKGVESAFVSQNFKSLKSKIKLKLGELEKIDPVAAHSILLAAKNYSWVFLRGVSLVEINDEFSNIQGENIQVAVRRNRIIQVNLSLFDKLDEKNKVALVFHELISALANDSFSSVKARALTGSLFIQDLMNDSNDLIRKIICETIACTKTSWKTNGYIFVLNSPLRNMGMGEFISTPKISHETTLSMYVSDRIRGTESLLDVFNENYPEKTCERLWDSTPRRKEKITGYKNKILLSYDDDSFLYTFYFNRGNYSFASWSNRGGYFVNHTINYHTSYVYSDLAVLGEFTSPYGEEQEVVEQVCVSKKRNGKCKKWEEQKKMIGVENKEMFLKSCQGNVRKIQKDNLKILEENVVLL